jgi:hypothetical protein
MAVVPRWELAAAAAAAILAQLLPHVVDQGHLFAPPPEEGEVKLYRVAPNCETWPNTLTENPPTSAVKLAHNLGQPCAIFVMEQGGPDDAYGGPLLFGAAGLNCTAAEIRPCSLSSDAPPPCCQGHTLTSPYSSTTLHQISDHNYPVAFPRRK